MSKTKTYTELYKESHKIDDAIDESYSREQILEAIQKSSILKIKAFDSGFPEGVVRENCINLLIKQVTDDRLPISVVINLAKSGSASADDIVVRILEVKGTSMELLEDINKYLDETSEESAVTETNSGGSSPNSSPTSSPTKKPADDHVVPANSNCNCVVSYFTGIIYDNPVLNLKIQNGLFGSLNFNPNFDNYNFDPKALIRAEQQATKYLPQVDDANLLNFDILFANAAPVVEHTAQEQASYSIFDGLGVTPAGLASLAAVAFVAISKSL